MGFFENSVSKLTQLVIDRDSTEKKAQNTKTESQEVATPAQNSNFRQSESYNMKQTQKMRSYHNSSDQTPKSGVLIHMNPQNEYYPRAPVQRPPEYQYYVRKGGIQVFPKERIYIRSGMGGEMEHMRNQNMYQTPSKTVKMGPS